MQEKGRTDILKSLKQTLWGKKVRKLYHVSGRT